MLPKWSSEPTVGGSNPSGCNRSSFGEFLLQQLLHEVNASHTAGFFHHHALDAISGLGVALAIILHGLDIRRDRLADDVAQLPFGDFANAEVGDRLHGRDAAIEH